MLFQYVNLIEGWNLFASSVNLFMASLFVFHREKISSIYLFQMSRMLGLWLMTSVSTFAIKMLANALKSFRIFFNWESRVQSPEDRVQGPESSPGSSPGFILCPVE